ATSYEAGFAQPFRPQARPPSRSPSMPTGDTRFQYPSSQQPYSERVPHLRMPPQPSPQFGSRQPPFLGQSPFPQQQPVAGPIHSRPHSPFSRAPTPTFHPVGARPLPNVGKTTSITSSPFPLEAPPASMRPHRTQRHQAAAPSPVHTRPRRTTAAPVAGPPKRRRPPEPYSSYSNML